MIKRVLLDEYRMICSHFSIIVSFESVSSLRYESSTSSTANVDAVALNELGNDTVSGASGGIGLRD